MAFREAARLLIAEPSEEARQGPRSSAEAPASPSAKRGALRRSILYRPLVKT